jgi:uncharacterized protein with von Willebrand factor type A (vWA) domain
MRRLARRLKQIRLRRMARAHQRRRLALQATIRRSVESGGTPIRLAWQAPRRVRPRLVLLLDVSRSMAAYSFFYLRLARALSGELADVHTFIFHTRVTAVSEALRDPDPWRAQERPAPAGAGLGRRNAHRRKPRAVQRRTRRAPGALAHRHHRDERRLRHRRAGPAVRPRSRNCGGAPAASCGSTPCAAGRASHR